ncbi:MAG: hypothetical protein ACI8UX_000906 [Psychromonas sp.]|jgi:hypothetical protein
MKMSLKLFLNYTQNWRSNFMLYKIELLRNSVLVLASAFFFSCEDPTDIGYPGTGSGQNQTFFSDTLSLSTSTYLMDSAITSNQSLAFVGSYTDPVFGKISSVAYLQPTLRTATNPASFQQEVSPFILSSTAIIDSVTIRVINNDSRAYGDSLPDLTLEVTRLTNALVTDQNYNYDQEVPYNPEILASRTLRKSDMVSPLGDSLFYVRIKLPDTIVEELRALANGDESMDTENFIAAFPGFRLSARANTGESMVSFNLGSVSTGNFSDLTIYYHEPGATFSNGYQFEFTAGRFNQITTDRSSTAFAALNSKTQSLSSDKTNRHVYVQAGNGTAARITFPGLSQLKNPLVGRANLIFKADTNTFTTGIPLSAYMTLVNLNENQTVARINSDYNYVNYTANATTGFLSSYVDSTNSFSLDITPYLQSITSQNQPDNGVILIAGIPSGTQAGGALAFNGNFNRIVLKDFKLEIYYTAK